MADELNPQTPDYNGAAALNTYGTGVAQEAENMRNELDRRSKLPSTDPLNQAGVLSQYVAAETQKIQGMATGQVTQAQLYGALAATMSVPQLMTMSKLEGTPTALKSAALDYITKKISTDATQSALEGHITENGSLDEAWLKKQPLPVANAIIQGYSALRQNQLQWGDPNDVVKRIRDQELNAVDPQHHPLPANFQKVTNQEWQTTAQTLQAEQVAAPIFSQLSDMGISPDNIREDAQTNKLARYFAEHKTPKAQIDAFYSVVGQDLQTKVAGINVDTAEAQRTSAQAGAFAAWPEAINKTFSNVFGMVGNVLSAGFMAWGGKALLDWASNTEFGKSHPWVGKMANVLDAAVNPILKTVETGFNSANDWAQKNDPQAAARGNNAPLAPTAATGGGVTPVPTTVASADIPQMGGRRPYNADLTPPIGGNPVGAAPGQQTTGPRAGAAAGLRPAMQ